MDLLAWQVPENSGGGEAIGGFILPTSKVEIVSMQVLSGAAGMQSDRVALPGEGAVEEQEGVEAKLARALRMVDKRRSRTLRRMHEADRARAEAAARLSAQSLSGMHAQMAEAASLPAAAASVSESAGSDAVAKGCVSTAVVLYDAAADCAHEDARGDDTRTDKKRQSERMWERQRGEKIKKELADMSASSALSSCSLDSKIVKLDRSRHKHTKDTDTGASTHTHTHKGLEEGAKIDGHALSTWEWQLSEFIRMQHAVYSTSNDPECTEQEMAAAQEMLAEALLHADARMRALYASCDVSGRENDFRLAANLMASENTKTKGRDQSCRQSECSYDGSRSESVAESGNDMSMAKSSGVFSCLRKEEVSSSIRTSSRHSFSASASQCSGISSCEVTTTQEQLGSNHRSSRALRETIEERNECWSSDAHVMYQEKEIDSGSITSATRSGSQTDLEAQTYHSVTDSFSGAVPCTASRNFEETWVTSLSDTSAQTAPEEGGEGERSLKSRVPVPPVTVFGRSLSLISSDGGKSDTSGEGERRLTNYERRLRGMSNFAKDRDQRQQEKEQLKSKVTVPTVTVFGRSLSSISSDGDDHVGRGEMALRGLSSGERDSSDESLGSGSIVMTITQNQWREKTRTRVRAAVASQREHDDERYNEKQRERNPSKLQDGGKWTASSLCSISVPASAMGSIDSKARPLVVGEERPTESVECKEDSLQTVLPKSKVDKALHWMDQVLSASSFTSVSSTSTRNTSKSTPRPHPSRVYNTSRKMKGEVTGDNIEDVWL
jgi:hypothetical protein